MFAVVVTYRPDFRECAVDQYPTREEAQDAAERLAAGHPEQVIRAWVRFVRTVTAGGHSPQGGTGLSG